MPWVMGGILSKFENWLKDKHNKHNHSIICEWFLPSFAENAFIIS